MTTESLLDYCFRDQRSATGSLSCGGTRKDTNVPCHRFPNEINDSLVKHVIPYDTRRKCMTNDTSSEGGRTDRQKEPSSRGLGRTGGRADGRSEGGRTERADRQSEGGVPAGRLGWKCGRTDGQSKGGWTE